MMNQYPEIFLFFSVTGILWWGWLVMKTIDVLCINHARKHHKLYYSVLQDYSYDFRLKPKYERSINDVDAKPTTITLDKKEDDDTVIIIPPKYPTKKWEKLNAEEEDNDSGRI